MVIRVKSKIEKDSIRLPKRCDDFLSQKRFPRLLPNFYQFDFSSKKCNDFN